MIAKWAARVESSARLDYDLACEVAQAAQVVKAYGEVRRTPATGRPCPGPAAVASSRSPAKSPWPGAPAARVSAAPMEANHGGTEGGGAEE